MSLQKKEIILNEIDFWKKNKLLPEHYCDFLTALYAQGEQIEEKDNTSKAVLAKAKNKNIVQAIMIGIITAILLATLIFITTAVYIPIIISGIVVFTFLYIAIKLAKTKSFMATLLFVFSALLLLGLSFKIWSVYFMEHPSILIGLIIGNCLMWLFTGLLLKLIYFSISGIVGIVFILFYLLI